MTTSLHRKKRLQSLGRRCMLAVAAFGLAAAVLAPVTATAAGSPLPKTKLAATDKLAALTLKSQAAPEAVTDFAENAITKLAADAPFTAWKNATAEYYPLGPGTHSWLVHVMRGSERIGYLIVSAVDGGGYTLSEYGAGTTGLPYSLTELRRFAAQEALIPSSSATLKLEALYAPLLPVWKLTVSGKAVYLNAVRLEVLPWNDSKAQAVLGQAAAEASLDPALAPASAYKSSGPDDPYRDLRWLTAPKLGKLDGAQLKTLLAGGSVAFQAAGRNDTVGGPFMVTGVQSWHSSSSAGGAAEAVYAASGLGGKRYLPLKALQQAGTLHPLPLAGNAALGVAPSAHSGAAN